MDAEARRISSLPDATLTADDLLVKVRGWTTICRSLRPRTQRALPCWSVHWRSSDVGRGDDQSRGSYASSILRARLFRAPTLFQARIETECWTMRNVKLSKSRSTGCCTVIGHDA
jgi:hypothetical protein